MAMMIPLCVLCKKEVFNGLLRGGNRWICNQCEPQDPEVNFRWYPSPYPDSRFILQAVVYAMRPCYGCGYLWGSKGVAHISDKELEDHGMGGHYLSEIEHSTREFVEGKRAAARNNALEHFKKSMETCKKCDPTLTKAKA